MNLVKTLLFVSALCYAVHMNNKKPRKPYRFSPMQGTATRYCRECEAERGQRHATWCKK